MTRTWIYIYDYVKRGEDLISYLVNHGNFYSVDLQYENARKGSHGITYVRQNSILDKSIEIFQ